MPAKPGGTHLLCEGSGLLATATGGALPSCKACAARLASSWSAPDLLPISMPMLACRTIRDQSAHTTPIASYMQGECSMQGGPEL